MKQYRILINERNYSSWKFQNLETNLFVDNEEELSILNKINPIEKKLFSKDLINEQGEIIHSYVRTCQTLAGVLLLENNKTFGRTQNKKKLLYKCIPDDKRLPVFLVPYDISLGFSKNIINKYVVFQFNKWTDKHPEGILTDVLGDVDKLDVFYEYQLYCRNLHDSMTTFNKKVRQTFHKEKQQEHIDKILENPNYQIENRTKSHTVYTIDPKTSLDYDDGFSIQLLPPAENGERRWNISIYIANVFFWLETFDLWKSFSKRVSTIYLPEQRRPMIPTILSDNLCSLLENQDRFAFCMDIEIIENDNRVVIKEDTVKFKNVLIHIAKNYEYEEPELLENREYMNFLNLTKKIEKNVCDSHDVISYWMTYTNKICAEKLADKKTGIFRSTVCSPKKNKKQILELISPQKMGDNEEKDEIMTTVENNYFTKKENENYEKLDKETKRLIENWNNISGKYTVFTENALLKHELLNMDCYAHITCPIRRLVDLLNQIIFFEKYGLVKRINDETQFFVENWLSQIEYINVSMRSIRKIQTDCEMMCKVTINPRIMDDIHEGTIFDKIKKNNGLFSFMVYLHDLKLLSRIVTTDEMENNSIHKFKLYFFGDEYNFKKKIKLMIYTS